MGVLLLVAAVVYNPFLEVRQTIDGWVVTDLATIGLSTAANLHLRYPYVLQQVIKAIAPRISLGLGMIVTIVHLAASYSAVAHYLGPTAGAIGLLVLIALKPGLLSIVPSFVGAYVAWGWNVVLSVAVAVPGLLAMFAVLLWRFPERDAGPKPRPGRTSTSRRSTHHQSRQRSQPLD
jgi:hypothetical protein